jgi:hypothetical protein
MIRHALALSISLLGLAGCGESPRGDALVSTVGSSPIAGVATLHASVSDTTRAGQVDFQVTPPVNIDPSGGPSFVLLFPPGTDGTEFLIVSALDGFGNEMAIGSGNLTVHPGETSQVQVQLTPTF